MDRHPADHPPGRVLVIGATGYIGTVVVEHLLAAGHDVVALLRPGPKPRGLPDDVAVRAGDLRDPASLVDAVTADIDAVLHLATPVGDEGTDRAALEALLSALRGSGRTLLYTSGTWVLGPTTGSVADETSRPRPIALVGYRSSLEELVLSSAEQGVRPVVVRPGVVHGRGGGIPAMLVDLAGEHGAGLRVGEHPVRWPMVHVDDLADLLVLALARAHAGQVLHAVHEPGVDTADLARAAASTAGVDGVRSWPLPDAGRALGGLFAEALACDQVVSADATRLALGWQPRRAGAVADVASGSYGHVGRPPERLVPQP